jgi:hypothetical protein
MMDLLASEEEVPERRRVWGTGGWLPPEQREALDWLTLARLSGWPVSIYRAGRARLPSGIEHERRWIVVAADPDALDEQTVDLLAEAVAHEPILVVSRAGRQGGGLSRLSGTPRTPRNLSGRSLCWTGPGIQKRWHCRKDLEACPLEIGDGGNIWVTLDGVPIVVARQMGHGMMVTVGFHPSEARDRDGAVTALLKHLLIFGAQAPVAWFDTGSSLVLRMDDPGGSQNIFSRSWCYPKLTESKWRDIGEDLGKRQGRLSVGYVTGWVDDGDPLRGTLTVSGNAVERLPGGVYFSPLVQYRDRSGHAPGREYDGSAEFRGIQALRAAGVADVELHGFTHMHPDTRAWAQAPDRFETWPHTTWFRELGRDAQTIIDARPEHEHPLSRAMRAFREFYDTHPTTLIPPGDQWTDSVLERALDLGLAFVSGYYLALRHQDRYVWVQHVCAPYLDAPDSAWFDTGLPVIGYFHDIEPSTQGVEWLRRSLDAWQAAGARRLLDFRELAGIVCRRLRLGVPSGQPHLEVTDDHAPALVRPADVWVRFPQTPVPSSLSVSLDGHKTYVSVETCDDNCGRITLSSAADRTGLSRQGA